MCKVRRRRMANCSCPTQFLYIYTLYVFYCYRWRGDVCSAFEVRYGGANFHVDEIHGCTACDPRAVGDKYCCCCLSFEFVNKTKCVFVWNSPPTTHLNLPFSIRIQCKMFVYFCGKTVVLGQHLISFIDFGRSAKWPGTGTHRSMIYIVDGFDEYSTVWSYAGIKWSYFLYLVAMRRWRLTIFWVR